MKNCPYCKMNIGGNLEKCPVCQNALEGEGERDYWPKLVVNSRRVKAFQIVMFAVISISIVALAMD